MKKLSLRFLVLFTLAFAAQLPVGHLLDGRPFEERDRLDRSLAERVDVVYLGDSVLESLSGRDVDRRDISQMLDDLLDNRSVVRVSHAGYGMEVYLRFAEYLARQPVRPRILVVPLNLRSFSALWPYSFEFERLRLAWGDLIGVGLYRPMTGLKLLPAPAGRGPALRSGEDFPRAAYGGALSPEHPRVRALKQLTEVCRKAGILPMVYVTPVDAAGGGPEVQGRVVQNVEICREAAGSLLDLSAAVADRSEFIGYEHLAERGRRRVASELASALKKVPR